MVFILSILFFKPTLTWQQQEVDRVLNLKKIIRSVFTDKTRCRLSVIIVFVLFAHTTISSLLAEAINVEVNMVDEWIGTIAGNRRRIWMVEWEWDTWLRMYSIEVHHLLVKSNCNNSQLIHLGLFSSTWDKFQSPSSSEQWRVCTHFIRR